jgi:hypothetical protein
MAVQVLRHTGYQEQNYSGNGIYEVGGCLGVFGRGCVGYLAWVKLENPDQVLERIGME